LVRQVDQLLRAAIPLAPIGKYTPVSAVATSVINRNHTIEYVIHGACPVLFGVVWPTAGIATVRPTVVEQWASLGLYNTTRPWCTELEFGGPAPPPTSPPPPAIPPSRVRVEAFATLEINPSGLSLAASAAFATLAISWADSRVAYAEQITGSRADGAALTRLTVHEGSRSTISVALEDPSQLEGLLTPYQDAADAAMCDFAEVTRCEVTAVLPSPPPSPPPPRLPPRPANPPPRPPARPPPPMLPAPTANETRRLQQATPSPRASTLPPAPRLPPRPPPDPPDPPDPPGPPSSPPLYYHFLNLQVDRSFVASGDVLNATTGPERLDAAVAEQSSVTCPATAFSCPTATLRNSSIEASALTGLRADVSLAVMAANVRLANGVAADLFVTLMDTSDLITSLSDATGVNVSITVSSLYAQYVHPRLGLIIIRGNLPPPPPARAPDATAATVDAVTTAVTTVVAAAVAAAVAGAVAGSVGGAAGGAAGGGAGGGGAGGGAGGGVAPLIFGVQRFSASSGLAANQSELQSGVAGGMGWASGSFGTFGGGAGGDGGGSRRRLSIWLARRLVDLSENATSNDENATSSDADINETSTDDSLDCVDWGRRRLAKGGGEEGGSATECGEDAPDTLAALIDNLVTFVMAMSLVTSVQVFAHIYWKKRMNNKYYEQREDEPDKFAMGKGIPFRPLPGVFVFPNMQNLVMSVFITGLVGKSIELLLDTNITCSIAQCRWPGLIILAVVGLFFLSGFVTLLHFWWYYSADSWEWFEPADLSEVDDPAYWLVSKIRLSCCPQRLRGKKFNLVGRVRGDWTKPEEDVVEPDRTERLLAHPVVLLRPRPGDAIDGNKMLWLNRASGSYGISGVLYEWLLLLIQLSIAILTGIGPGIEPGSPEADAQMFAVICLQYGIAVYTMFGGPSADRIDNFVITAQYLTEGTCTLLLLVSGFPELFDLQPLIQMAVFLLLLFGMFIPILEKGYEAVVVQLIRCVYNMKEMSITECCIAIVGFLTVIPSMLAALIGMDAGDGLLETFMDEGVNAAASAAEEAEAIAAVMDNLLFNMRQKYAGNKINAAARKRYGKKQRAATKVQSKARGHQVRARQRWQGAGQKPLAAVLIQRAFLTKRNLKREGISLKKVQINQIRYRTALKSRVGIGSHWTNVGPERPAAGSEIFSKRLEAALRKKQEFSDEEVAAFEVLLRMDSFIKVDEQYFEQAGSASSSSIGGGQAAGSVSKATGSTASSPNSVGTSRRGRQAKKRMAGEQQWGSFSSFGFSKASSPNSKQPRGRPLLEDVPATTEPAAAETAVVEPVAAQTRADPKAAAAAALLAGGVVSEREISQVNFGTWDASWDSNNSSEVEMRPGMQWLVENMNRTTLMFVADEDGNNEDGMSVDSPEQHPDRMYRFETVQERVTRARASLPSGLPKSVPVIYGAAKSRSAAKSLGKRPGKLPPGLSPGLLPSSAPLSAVSPATSLVQDVRRCGGGAASSSSELERGE
jgi:hypothetical protein